MDYYDDDEFEGGRKKGTKWSAAERKKRGYGSKTSKPKAKPKKRVQRSLALPKSLTKSDLRKLMRQLLAEMRARGLERD
jgi:hypothetical protein